MRLSARKDESQRMEMEANQPLPQEKDRAQAPEGKDSALWQATEE